MDCQEPKLLSANYLRRFGVELEINAFDGRNRPAGGPDVLPDGAHYVGEMVRKITNDPVLLHKWNHDHNNQGWIIKPDSSCGMEVCSPVSKGWYGLKKICRVVEGLQQDEHIVSDLRCSLHVHIEVSDMTTEELASVIAWWVKCEPVFFDSVPTCRKRNRYCQFLGLTDIFEHDSVFTAEVLIKRLGICKYSSLNTYHLRNGKRHTIEFRIMENDACLNAYMTKNWIRLLIHFVEMTYRRRMPLPYVKNDPWTGWLWLDPKEVVEVLGFAPDQFRLSPGLEQTRTWFLSRLYQHTMNTGLPGVFTDLARRRAFEQTRQLILDLNLPNILEPQDSQHALFGEEFRV